MRKDEVKETGIASIKQRIKDRKALGTAKKYTRVVSTLKEAKALIELF